VYRTSQKIREHTGVYYRRSQKGTEVEGSIKKYLATTIGRGLDMRSLIRRKKPAVR
jgi:hypothetical protein